MKLSVILPAAGSGKRFGNTSEGNAAQSKVEVRLSGRPVFMHAVDLFQHRDDVSQIIIAVDPESLDRFHLSYGDQLGFLGVSLIAGGTVDRWQTVQKALRLVDEDATHVVVHDAARPLTGKAIIDRLVQAAGRHDAVVPVIPVDATLKRVGPEIVPEVDREADPLDAILDSAGRPEVAVCPVLETIDRTGVVEVQTPQIFSRELIVRAYARIEGKPVDEVTATDDAGLVELIGAPVATVAGELTNLKITRPDDLRLAEAIVAATARERVAGEGWRRLFADDEEDA